MSFLGQYEHNLDSKDRLTVPSRFRAALADGVVLAKGLEPSVWVFAPAGYERFTQQFLRSRGHAASVHLATAAQHRVQPTAGGAIMSRRG